jgi:hypothetical protein
MTFKRKLLATTSALFLLCSCGDDDGDSAGGSSVTYDAAQAVTTANSKLKAVSDMLGSASSSSSLQHGDLSPLASGLAAVWTTDPGVSPLSNMGTSSLQTWFSQQFDETFQNSNEAKVTFAGRISNTLDVFCFMANSGETMDPTTGLPPIGTYTVVLTEAMNTTCGGGIDSEAIGQSVALTVTATTDSTLYDRLLSFELPGSSDCPFKYYARVSSTEVNIATSEDQSCDSSRDHASRSVFTYNASTQVSRFYYTSRAFSDMAMMGTGYEVYRGYLNESTDEAYIVGFYGGDSDFDTDFESGIAFTAVGKPSGTGTVAVSAKSINNTIADGEYQACVNPSDLSIGTDNSLACTLTGTDALSAYTNVVQDLYDDFASRSELYNIGETVSVGFTDSSDIFN